MKRMLVKFMSTDKAAWDEYLDHCMFAYNTSRHESSLYSPFEVMFERKPTISIELEYEKEGSVLPKAYLQEPTVDTVSELTVRRQQLLKQVADNIQVAQERQKATYDRKHANPSRFLVGTTVLKDLRREKCQRGKMDPQWLGLYKDYDENSSWMPLEDSIFPQPAAPPHPKHRLPHTDSCLQPLIPPHSPNKLWYEDSIPAQDGVKSSSPVQGCRFFPPFFPNSVDPPSPILHQSPPQQAATLVKVVNSKAKTMACKRRETLRQEREGKDAVGEVIDLDADVDTISQPLSPPLPLQHDEHILLKGEWLDDVIINEGQQLIRQEFPHVRGLKEVALGHTMASSVEPGELVQVLHAGNHWVTISTIGCGPAKVDIYDSGSPAPTSLLQQQIAALICTKHDTITVRYSQCQRQEGYSDCGICPRICLRIGDRWIPKLPPLRPTQYAGTSALVLDG